MNTCPCCSEVMLRHARHNGVYWFCHHCWQEMPDLSAAAKYSPPSSIQLPTIASPVLTR